MARKKAKRVDDVPNSVVLVLLVLTIIILAWSTLIFLSATDSLNVNASNNAFNNNADGKVQFTLQKPPVSTATVGFNLENSSTTK